MGNMRKEVDRLKKDGWTVNWDQAECTGTFLAIRPDGKWVRFSRLDRLNPDYPNTVEGVRQARRDYE